MGNSRSKLRKLSRRGSCDNLTTVSLPCPAYPEGSSKVNSRSHSLASNAASSDISSRISVPDDHDLCLGQIDIPPKMLTQEQLALVNYSWQVVLNDTSNICLNFFHQLQRRFPHIKRLQKSHQMVASTPSLPSSIQLMTRNRSLFSGTSDKRGMVLPQQALKLACCIDNLIGSLIRNQGSVEEKVSTMLESSGISFKQFLGFESLYHDSFNVREMSVAFAESLRLILVHNCSEIQWCEELKQAWIALFQILLYHLDGIDDDF